MTQKIPEGLMVSVSGFRGRVGDPLTPELVCELAGEFTSFLRERNNGKVLVVARDSRTSGSMLARAVCAGILSRGVNVIDLGIVATPTAMLTVEKKNALGGIMISASHNPAEWNALKLVSHDGSFLDVTMMTSFLNSISEESLGNLAPWDQLGSYQSEENASDTHVKEILDLSVLDLQRLRKRKFKVALDCVRGAGGVIMPLLLEALGCEVVAIHTEVDGKFPRDPEPTADNLLELSHLVKTTGAEVGFAVDPDVDRLSLVDEHGTPLGEDMTLAFATDVVLNNRPGSVVTNLSTSQVIDDVVRHHGGQLTRTSVGEINVVRGMQKQEAPIGGEGNGGVILSELHHTRDAPLAAALVLQHLLERNEALSECASRWPRYVIQKTKITIPKEKLPQVYDVLKSEMSGAHCDETDGLRMYWSGERKWVHIRPSGTEPIVRLIAEACDQKTVQALIDDVVRHLEDVQ
tara:strand:+ start:1330 stop:2718 length:1389 start_codon:yes stop_codon:yes gene_type:complete